MEDQTPNNLLAVIARLQVELNNAVQFARFVNEDRDKLRVQKAALVAALENCSKRLLDESTEAGWPLEELKDISPGSEVYKAWGIILNARAALEAAKEE
jgi:hypothetical protein